MSEKMTPQEAYEAYRALALEAQRISDAVKPNFDYSPFEYIPHSFNREIAKCREDLIKKRSEELRQEYMPNIRLDRFPGFPGFEKLMDDAVGHENYAESVFINWFAAQLQDEPSLEIEAHRQILERASHFLPWHSGTKTTNINEIYDSKRTLHLQAHTWSGANIAYELNYNGKFEALEKAIRMAIYGEQASKPQFGGPIWHHVTYKGSRGDALFFYRKVEPISGPVESFVFYKNGKLVVRFKNDHQARVVAELLLVGTNKGGQ